MKATLIIFLLIFVSCNETSKKDNTDLNFEKEATTNVTDANKNVAEIPITPIAHGTLILQMENKTIYIDPVGGKEVFKGQPSPDIILVTDIHGDHLNIETLEAIATPTSLLIIPQAVANKLPKTSSQQFTVLKNSELLNFDALVIEAIPMYNLREEALKFHQKGRGNGYVIEGDNQRVYISGDTEDIPEMRQLKNIDIAFVCMNLPYAMTVESAASAVLDFKPKKVYPYHYRGTEGLSDVARFKELVSKKNLAIEVIQLDWYPSKK